MRRIDWIDLRSQRLAEFVMRHPRWAIPAAMVLARLGVFKSG